MLLGGADDYPPAPACLAHAEWLRGRGATVETRLYAGALHNFDLASPPRHDPAFQTARNCRAAVQVETGPMTRLDTGEVLAGQTAITAYLRTCLEYGATFGGNANALAEAQRDVAAFLGRAFAR